MNRVVAFRKINLNSRHTSPQGSGIKKSRDAFRRVPTWVSEQAEIISSLRLRLLPSYPSR
jgi:hypothetical protein